MDQTLHCQKSGCPLTAYHFDPSTAQYLCYVHSEEGQGKQVTTEFKEISEDIWVVKACIRSVLVGLEEGESGAGVKKLVNKVRKRITECEERLKFRREEQKKMDYGEVRKQLCCENMLKIMVLRRGIRMIEIFPRVDHRLTAGFQEMQNNFELMSIHNKKIKERQKRNEKFKQVMVSFADPSTIRGFNCLYEAMTDKKISIEDSEDLVLDFKNQLDIEFMKSIRDFKIPDVYELELRNIPEDMSTFRDFIYTSFPDKVGRFDFDCNTSKKDCDQILDLISHVSPKVTSELYLYSCELSQYQLRRFLAATRQNQASVGLPMCKIDLDSVPDFGNSLNGSKIEEISLSFCGGPDYSDWKRHPHRFENLIQGLSQSDDFVRNLQHLNLNGCGIQQEDALQVLEQYRLSHVILIDTEE
ncbi:unnamed protein product [Moneuplotes crassus]|uniref:Uncharacterized protein n=1 Tax=Euplotes crassus TaxID=5936 RepID=A0AAD1UID8_EUPCR|nr:unnamed protein product [Moneuplotes crassus]